MTSVNESCNLVYVGQIQDNSSASSVGIKPNGLSGVKQFISILNSIAVLFLELNSKKLESQEYRQQAMIGFQPNVL